VKVAALLSSAAAAFNPDLRNGPMRFLEFRVEEGTQFGVTQTEAQSHVPRADRSFGFEGGNSNHLFKAPVFSGQG
jgi:hypothetical protein